VGNLRDDPVLVYFANGGQREKEERKRKKRRGRGQIKRERKRERESGAPKRLPLSPVFIFTDPTVALFLTPRAGGFFS
jgi:hypothetical protein